MSFDVAEDYLYAKHDQALLPDEGRTRTQRIAKFLDDKSYKPGLGTFAQGEE